MSRLITAGNLAIFEYPEGAENPDFNFDKDGVLFVFGYKFRFMEKEITVAKRFETKLSGYHMIGNYSAAVEQIQGDFSNVIEEANIDVENSLFFITNQPELLNSDKNPERSVATEGESSTEADSQK